MDTPALPSIRSSELLGYPADARVLIVNCDDLGIYEAVNVGVIESIERGIASSCSLLVPGPSAARAMGLLRDRPSIPFGIHLSLVCDLPGNRWGPLAAKQTVPSLLDDAGELFAPTQAGRAELLNRARLDEVELEFRAQLNAVAVAGLTATHLDFHCLADGGRADIFELTTALAAEHDLAVRVWLDASRQPMRRRGLPVTDNDFLDSFALDLDGKSARYAQLLRDLPVGLSEWAVHPSVGGEQARSIDDGWRVRRTDYEFLTSPEAGEVIAQEGIVVIDYRALQQVWARAGN